MVETMKAVYIRQFGGPDVLKVGDVPLPRPRPDEVLIRVHASSVNPVDCKTRAGAGMTRVFGKRLPLVLGWDVSGVVVQSGSAVSSLKPGDEVFGLVRFPQPAGTHAEYVCAPETELTLKPRRLTHLEAAGVPLVALTAWQVLFEAAELRGSQTVLIHAAAGGVGHVAVQLARWKGARVIGTASPYNADFLRSLGVEEVIDYNRIRFEDEVSDVDVVLDAVGGDVYARSFAAVRPGGVIVSVRSKPDARPAGAIQRGVRARYVLVRPEASQLGEIATLLESGVVRPFVQDVFPLASISKAHEASETGHTRGKLVLQVV